MDIQLTDEQRIKIVNSDDVYTIMRDILLREEKIDQEKEHFWLLSLAGNSCLLNIELVSLGSAKTTIVEPMNVYRVAILKGAVQVIMVHNHPSGTLNPSEADKDLTDRLIQVGEIINIKVVDHLVISTESYLSFSKEGIMAALRLSTKWVPQYELIKRIRKEEKKIRDEAIKLEREIAEKTALLAEKKGVKKGKKEGIIEGEKKRNIEIARGMKKKKYSLNDIIELTGLTKEEIEKIK